MTPHSYELTTLNCGSSNFKTRYNKKITDNFAYTPPTSLIQNYYKCKYTTTTIIQNSLSQAFANTTALQGLFMIILLFTIRFYIKKRYGPLHGEQQQIDEILNQIALERIAQDKADELWEAETAPQEPGLMDRTDNKLVLRNPGEDGKVVMF